MAIQTEKQPLDKSGVIETLAEAIGEQVETKRKASEKVPEVYSSGMRGREKPPHLREKPAKKKDENAPEERYDENGRRIVTFKAKPRISGAQQLEAMQKQIDDLKKQLAGKKPAAAKPAARKVKVKIS